SMGKALTAAFADPNTGPEIKRMVTQLGVKVQDFVYQGNKRGGVITPIHSGDEFIGMRPRGTMDNAMSGGGGGGTATININVYSNNLEEVKRAIYQAAHRVGVGGRKQNKAGKGNYGKKHG
ncbi:MAG: hypothetical protein NZ659_07735, partial [Acidimicrobiales bacterium]|nr:hypothetical protein [Acidimicrobiales bacterium]